MMHNYWFAYVGNVLGTAGITTAAKGWGYEGVFAHGNNIWMLGWNSDPNNPSRSDPNLTASSGAFIFRHGNYDYVNAAVQWDANTPDRTLPKSFYLSSKPAFFTKGSGYEWPWVVPTNSSPWQSGPTTSAWTANVSAAAVQAYRRRRATTMGRRSSTLA